MNLFQTIERALRPEDPWKPARVLAADLEFKVPAKVLKERERVTKVYRDSMNRIEELGNSLGKLLDDGRAAAREKLESGASCTGLRTKEEHRKDIRKEIKFTKMGLTDILSEFAETCRPVVADFVKAAVPHIEAIIEAERSECTRFGLDYVEGSLAHGLRQAVALIKTAIPTDGALNNPASYLPWLTDTTENPFN